MQEVETAQRTRWDSACYGGLAAALGEPGRAHALGHRGELRKRSAPPELLHLLEERRVGAKRREPLEEERQRAAVAQHVVREALDRAVTIQQSRGAGRTDAGDPREAVGRI